MLGPQAPRPGDPLRAARGSAAAATVATLLLIALGGAARATDSGLACPDWPACYGRWIPPADLHIWLEHSHRLWAGVVGLLILGLTRHVRRAARRARGASRSSRRSRRCSCSSRSDSASPTC